MIGDGGYDGDAERPDAWKSSLNGEAGQMRWTNKSKQSNGNLAPPKPPSAPRRNSSKSPFALGDDDEEEEIPSGAVSPSNRPLPSDAVDLVTEDSEKVEEARVRGRTRGEPQKTAPSHVYIHHDPESNSAEEVEEVHESSTDVAGMPQTSEEMDDEDVPGAELIQRLETVEEVSHADRTLFPSVSTPYDEDNPWA